MPLWGHASMEYAEVQITAAVPALRQKIEEVKRNVDVSAHLCQNRQLSQLSPDTQREGGDAVSPQETQAQLSIESADK